MITQLQSNQVLVFGSNLRGVHGAGAALQAKRDFGAREGCGSGPQGKCYAIPTKDSNIDTLPLDVIQKHVEEFLAFAKRHSDLQFLVTAIGTGLAGYEPRDIAPMFHQAPNNVVLPQEFLDFYRSIADMATSI